MTRPKPLDCRTVRGTLPDENERSHRSVQAHLEECDGCRADAKRLEVAWAALRLLEDREPSPRFTAGVLGTVDRDRPRPWFVHLWHGTSPGFRWAAVASFVAVIVLISSLALNRERTSTTPHRAGVVAELDAVESQDLLQNLEIIDNLDLLLLMDDG